MHFSTDLPSGSKAIAEHLASGMKLKINVSQEVDTAFMAELRRTDAKRYERLYKNMFVDAKADKSRCEQCGLVRPKLRSNSVYCGRSCQQAAYRARLQS